VPGLYRHPRAEQAPGSFGPLPDDTLISRGLWRYAPYYDPAGLDVD
jgi:hypothetical protein